MTLETELKRIEGDNVYYNDTDLSRLTAALLQRGKQVEELLSIYAPEGTATLLRQRYDSEILALLRPGETAEEPAE